MLAAGMGMGLVLYLFSAVSSLSFESKQNPWFLETKPVSMPKTRKGNGL